MSAMDHLVALSTTIDASSSIYQRLASIDTAQPLQEQ